MRTVELLHVCGLKRVFSLAGCNPMFLLELELEEITLRRYHRCPLFDVRFVNQEGKLGSKSIYLLISRLAILSKFRFRINWMNWCEHYFSNLTIIGISIRIVI